MLRHKRYSLHRTSLNNSLNLANIQNANLPPPQHQNFQLQYKNPSWQHRQPKSNRSCLKELQSFTNLPYDYPDASLLKPNSFCPADTRCSPIAPRSSGDKGRDKENILSKISELIRNEELGLPVCHSSKSKQQVQSNSHNNRTYTSLSHITRKSLQQSNCQGQLVLHLTRIEQPDPAIQPHKMSTSRALMNYSKVFRHSSGDRFKVRRERPSSERFVNLSAQKIVLQQKERKERKQVQRIVQKQASSRMGSRKKVERAKHRYAEQQQFELGGWEYFQ